MGVRGLMTIMKENCLLTEVYLREKVIKYRCCHKYSPEQQVFIVVDALSCLRYWYGESPWLYGGQWYELKENMAHFIKSFDNLGISLIFFFDGTVENAKRQTWCERRLEERENRKLLYDDVIAGNGQLPGRYSNVRSLPPSISGITKLLLKYEFGQTLIAGIGEGDRAMAEYAVRNNCMAILSDDTDFIIYNSVPCYSCRMLDVPRMYTLCFDRDKLCRHLDVDARYLPILAVLSGNDMISSVDLRFFHEQIQPQGYDYRSLIYNVANFLYATYLGRHVTWRHVEFDDLINMLTRDMPQLCGLNFASAAKSYLLTVHRNEEEFGKSTLANVQTKKLPRVPDHIFDEVVRRHLECDLFSTELATLMGVDSNVGAAYEDVRTGLPPYGDLYKSLRSRMSGFMLQVTPAECEARSVWINEWNMSSLNIDADHPSQLYLQSVLVNGSVCDVSQVWSTGSDELKLSAFWRIMGLPEKLDTQIPVNDSDLYCVIAVLHYLYTCLVATGEIEQWEIQLILLHVFTVRSIRSLQCNHDIIDEHSSESPVDISKAIINPRAINLAVILMMGVGRALSALLICKLQHYVRGNLPWNYFNGRMFHTLYSKAAAAANATLEDLVGPAGTEESRSQIINDVRHCMEFFESTIV